eukprot:m.52823 g.52823  ORF g.52823 m.52823 type:complete len:181 (-) comp16584_c0_seq1:121-663(-)
MTPTQSSAQLAPSHSWPHLSPTQSLAQLTPTHSRPHSTPQVLVSQSSPHEEPPTSPLTSQLFPHDWAQLFPEHLKPQFCPRQDLAQLESVQDAPQYLPQQRTETGVPTAQSFRQKRDPGATRHPEHVSEAGELAVQGEIVCATAVPTPKHNSAVATVIVLKAVIIMVHFEFERSCGVVSS